MTSVLDYQPPAAQQRNTWRSALRLVFALGPVLSLGFVFAIFAVQVPRTFLSIDNMQIMLLQTAVIATAALGATMVIISGGIDLSVGSNIAFCTVVVATLLNAHVPPLWAAVGGIAASAAWGLLIGTLVTGLQLLPFIVTLGLWGAIRGAAKGVANETTVEAPNTWLNHLLRTLGPHDHGLFPPGVWLMLGLTLLVAAILRYTRFGRRVFAVGSSEPTARLCGVPVNRTKLLIYTLAGLFAGIAGVLQFSYLTEGDPTTANGYELNVIAACVIGGASLSGGAGTVFGSLVGALLMTIVGNGCTKLGISNWVQDIVTGGIIIVAAALDKLRERYAGKA